MLASKDDMTSIIVLKTNHRVGVQLRGDRTLILPLLLEAIKERKLLLPWGRVGI